MFESLSRLEQWLKINTDYSRWKAVAILVLLYLNAYHNPLFSSTNQVPMISPGTFGLPVANAQNLPIDPCAQYPLKGKTAAIEVGPNKVVDAGIMYFDPALIPQNPSEKIQVPAAAYRACAIKIKDSNDDILKTFAQKAGISPDDLAVKGWVWNTNFGWVSFSCSGGNGSNMGLSCGKYPYFVTINQKGDFSGYAWSQTGSIRFNCASTVGYNDESICQKYNGYPGIRVVFSKLDQYGYTKIQPNPTYALTQSVGWMNFQGLLVPFKSKPIPLDEIDKQTRDEINKANDVTNPDATCFPGKNEPCAPYTCATDHDEDGYCPNTIPKDCDDNDPFKAPIGKLCDPGAKEEPIKDPFADPAVDIAFNKPFFRGNKVYASEGMGIGVSIRNNIRNIIFKNVQQLKRSASTQCGTLGKILKFPFQEKVFYCDGGLIGGDIVIGPMTPWKGRKTLIVEDANVFIQGDIYPEDTEDIPQLGLIVLRKNLNDKKKGNVYIAGNVRALRLQLYADGSIFPAVIDPSDPNKKKLKKIKEGPFAQYGFPELSGEDYKDKDNATSLFGQLLLRGQFITHNSVDQYFNNEYIDGYGNTLTDNSEGKTIAKMYSLGFLRSVPLNSEAKKKLEQKGETCDKDIEYCIKTWLQELKEKSGKNKFTAKDFCNEKSKYIAHQLCDIYSNYELTKMLDEKSSIIIMHEPPADDLPGFTGSTTMSIIQK